LNPSMALLALGAGSRSPRRSSPASAPALARCASTLESWDGGPPLSRCLGFNQACQGCVTAPWAGARNAQPQPPAARRTRSDKPGQPPAAPRRRKAAPIYGQLRCLRLALRSAPVLGPHRTPYPCLATSVSGPSCARLQRREKYVCPRFFAAAAPAPDPGAPCGRPLSGGVCAASPACLRAWRRPSTPCCSRHGFDSRTGRSRPTSRNAGIEGQPDRSRSSLARTGEWPPWSSAQIWCIKTEGWPAGFARVSSIEGPELPLRTLTSSPLLAEGYPNAEKVAVGYPLMDAMTGGSDL